MGLADDMVPAIRRRHEGANVERVVETWEKGVIGEVTRKEWADKGSQIAASYIEGLYTETWHDPGRYPWIETIEAGANVIRDELRRACAEGAKEGAAWAPAVGDDAEAYGAGWQKLVLQDRTWQPAVCDLFPKTREIIEGCGAPSVEVMFARQSTNSGIKPHTDNSNFFVTAHLALEVPDGDDCWIRVGKEKRSWFEDKALVFDSSFVHETRNDATSDRTVLLIRFWHPQLTQAERSALEFIFSVLDDPTVLQQSFEPPVEAANPSDAAADPLELESQAPVSVSSVPPGDTEAQGPVSITPLGPAEEAARLEGFLADLKSEGLLPDAGTQDDLLARAPKNRGSRRKASKARKKASRPGKGKKS